MNAQPQPENVAVIGSGVAGLGAAWALCRRHDVTLFERDGRAGGHAHTVDARLDGRDVPVDTGFIVYNAVNYPHLVRLFDVLNVPTARSDMSFAVSLHDGEWEMAGRLSGLFGSFEQLSSRAHWTLLGDCFRFFREAETALTDPGTENERLGSWLGRNGYGKAFVGRFLVPMAAAIWSSTAAGILDYPVRTFVQFFRNHGLLKFVGRIPWRTVRGGSRSYVDRVLHDMSGAIVLNAGISQVLPSPGGPCLVMRDGDRRACDAVVLATHADEAGKLLSSDPDPERRAALSAFGYQPNEAVLHTDSALMPRRRRLWSSWNYHSRGDGGGDRAVALTYWMNRLQGIGTHDQVFVTLNPALEPDPGRVMARIAWDHPRFDFAALRAQRELRRLQGRDGIWFCGSYTGYGFHEDGLRSGLGVADALGSPAPWWRDEDRGFTLHEPGAAPLAEAA